MTAETIPAEVRDLARKVVADIAADAGMPRRADAVMIGDMDDGPEIRSAICAILADRSTRPAEPAPEVEVGDGEALALAFKARSFARWLRNNPGDIHPEPSDYDELASMIEALWATLEAERARADELRRERDAARADRGTIAAEADHWKAKAEDADLWRDQYDVARKDREFAETALSRALQDRDEDRAALAQAEAGLAAMIRLADMGLEDSLHEPEENGNFAAYEEGKRCLDQVRARLRADQPAGEGGGDA